MAEPRPSNYQDVQDEKLRALENKAPTTKTTMGEGKPPSFLGRIKEMVTPSKLPTYGKRTRQQELDEAEKKMKKGGSVKYAKGGSVSSRGDGIAQRGKTKGRFV